MPKFLNKNKSAQTNQLDERVAVASDLDYNQMRALLKTMAEDDHVVIHKLEIRFRAQRNDYRVIVRASREENPAEPKRT